MVVQYPWDPTYGSGGRSARLLVLIEASLEEREIHLQSDAREYMIQSMQANEPRLEPDAWGGDLFQQVSDEVRQLEPPVSAYEVSLLHAGRLAERLREGARSEQMQELSVESVSAMLAGMCPLPPIC